MIKNHEATNSDHRRRTPSAIEGYLLFHGNGYERSSSKDDRGVRRKDRKEVEEITRKATDPPGVGSTQRTLTAHSWIGGSMAAKILHFQRPERKTKTENQSNYGHFSGAAFYFSTPDLFRMVKDYRNQQNIKELRNV
jgi:hypothetical protein